MSELGAVAARGASELCHGDGSRVRDADLEMVADRADAGLLVVGPHAQHVHHATLEEDSPPRSRNG